MFAKIRSLGLFGIGGYEVNVECFLSGGLPGFDVVGLPDAAVKEARDRDGARKWSASRNLKQPLRRSSDAKTSNRMVKMIAHDIRNEAKIEMERVYPSYSFVDCKVYYSDQLDGVYIRVLMWRRRK